MSETRIPLDMGFIIKKKHMEKATYTLTKKIIKEIKSDLEVQMEKLENELRQFATQNIHNSDDFQTAFPDYGDKEDEHTAEIAAFSDNLSLEHSLKKSLRDVKKALMRIEKGEYGQCKYCNLVINPLRLKARPASSSCVECKVKLKGG